MSIVTIIAPSALLTALALNLSGCSAAIALFLMTASGFAGVLIGLHRSQDLTWWTLSTGRSGNQDEPR
jgi:fatty-acid desaturase